MAKRRGKLELAKTRLEDKISNSKLGKRRRSAKQKANDKRLGMSRKKTKSATVKRKSVSKKSNTMAKQKSTRRFSRARSTGGKIFGSPLLKKAMIGIGAGTLAGTVVNMVAPQFAPIAKPIAAFATGGVVGAAASLIISPDGLGSITGLLGGGTGTTTGGLSV